VIVHALAATLPRVVLNVKIDSNHKVVAGAGRRA
jgi:hypothetical protein